MNNHTDFYLKVVTDIIITLCLSCNFLPVSILKILFCKIKHTNLTVWWNPATLVMKVLTDFANSFSNIFLVIFDCYVILKGVNVDDKNGTSNEIRLKIIAAYFAVNKMPSSKVLSKVAKEKIYLRYLHIVAMCEY